tara:strand:+ start:1141 stop:1407 length:267 start_codon:yes stop_codon:yes gene_type:complete
MGANKVLAEVSNILEERGKKYGNYKDNFEETAGIWSVVLGKKITIEDFALCMIAVKMNRLKVTPKHKDSWLDIIGYSTLIVQGLDDES